MIDLIRRVQELERQVQQQTNVEFPDAYITLTRTSLLAVGLAGINVTWEAVTRSNLFNYTPPAVPIVVPTAGYYSISVYGNMSVAQNDLLVRLNIDGILVQSFAAVGDVDRTFFVATFMRYLDANATIRINILPSAAGNLLVSAEGTVTESPFVNIVQLTRGAV